MSLNDFRFENCFLVATFFLCMHFDGKMRMKGCNGFLFYFNKAVGMISIFGFLVFAYDLALGRLMAVSIAFYLGIMGFIFYGSKN